MHQFPGVLEQKRSIIVNNLQRAYMMANEPRPSQFETIVNYWVELCVDIPVQDLQECFTFAIKNNNKYKVVQIGQVVKAFLEIRKAKINSEDLSRPEVSNPPGWYLSSIYRCREKWPEFDSVFSQINVDDPTPIDTRNNPDDARWMEEVNFLYNKRFGGKLAHKFDMNKALNG